MADAQTMTDPGDTPGAVLAPAPAYDRYAAESLAAGFIPPTPYDAATHAARREAARLAREARAARLGVDGHAVDPFAAALVAAGLDPAATYDCLLYTSPSPRDS